MVCWNTKKENRTRASSLRVSHTLSLSLAYPSNRCLCVRARRHHPVVVVVVVATQGYKTVRPRNRPRAKRRVDGAKIFNASQPAATLKLKLPSRISQPTAAEKSKAKIAIDSSSSSSVECGVKCVLKAAKFMLKIDNHWTTEAIRNWGCSFYSWRLDDFFLPSSHKLIVCVCVCVCVRSVCVSGHPESRKGAAAPEAAGTGGDGRVEPTTTTATEENRVGKYSKKPYKEPHNFSAAKETNAKKQQGRQPGHPGCVSSGEEAPPKHTAGRQQNNLEQWKHLCRAERGRNRGKCGRAFSAPPQKGFGREGGCYYDFGGAAGSLESRASVACSERMCLPGLSFIRVCCACWLLLLGELIAEWTETHTLELRAGKICDDCVFWRNCGYLQASVQIQRALN